MINNYEKILEQKSQFKKIIYNNGKKLTYQKNETIVLADDILENIYYLDKGRIKYCKQYEDGTTQIYQIIDSNILIGVLPILQNNNIIENDVISDATCEIYAINIDTFFSLINSSIVFRYFVLNDISSSMENVVRKNINSRLLTNKDIFYSYVFKNINSEEIIEGCWYNIYPQYSQQEYADLLGVSRMTISKIIKSLCKEGKIRLINHGIQVRICGKGTDLQ